MSTGRVKLFNIDADTLFKYCRKHEGGANWVDYDAECIDPDNASPMTLWEDADDMIYIGRTLTTGFFQVGFDMAVAGDYGDLTFEYSKGAGAWGALTPTVNSTLNFTRTGYVQWEIPDDWATDTVNLVADIYWIRASQDKAVPNPPAQAYNLLESIHLYEPLLMNWTDTRASIVSDINGIGQTIDRNYKGPDKLVIECTQLAALLPELSLLHYWKEYTRKLKIKDMAQTIGVLTSADAYYRAGIGYLIKPPVRAQSPSKMNPYEYELEFKIQAVTTMASLLGVVL